MGPSPDNASLHMKAGVYGFEAKGGSPVWHTHILVLKKQALSTHTQGSCESVALKANNGFGRWS